LCLQLAEDLRWLNAAVARYRAWKRSWGVGITEDGCLVGCVRNPLRGRTPLAPDTTPLRHDGSASGEVPPLLSRHHEGDALRRQSLRRRRLDLLSLGKRCDTATVFCEQLGSWQYLDFLRQRVTQLQLRRSSLPFLLFYQIPKINGLIYVSRDGPFLSSLRPRPEGRR
jgi:hypothetical protein